jgi:non-canonical purine NTP pyrophosphatase (RdgB/HAM1 family)
VENIIFAVSYMNLEKDNQSKVVFVTGNKNKADYLSQYLNYKVDNVKLELDEIQSMNLDEIVTHKVKQAFNILNRPVLVEDVSLGFNALGGLPGPFIKYFVDNTPFEVICSMVDGYDRSATAKCVFGYYDGNSVKLFRGSLDGKISESPQGENGYGWDQIFIPEGYTVTRASLNEEDDKKTYLKIKPFKKLKLFLEEVL